MDGSGGGFGAGQVQDRLWVWVERGGGVGQWGVCGESEAAETRTTRETREGETGFSGDRSVVSEE